jgi:hypothetical protein
MTQYDNTNRGQIWPNDKKQTDSHPDFRGELNVDGVMYWVSAWKRKPDANPKAPSLTFALSKKEVPQETRRAAAPAPFDDFDDSIPF